MTISNYDRFKNRFLYTGIFQPFLVDKNHNQFYMYYSETIFGEALKWTSLKQRFPQRWNIAESNLLKKYLKKGMIGLDLGSNLGYYALAMAQKCEYVYAFEPMKRWYKILCRNIALNHLEHKIYPVMLGADKVKKNKLKAIRKFDGESIEVVNLDRFFKEIKKPDIIKMDIEGAEIAAIKGGREVFKNAKCVIFEEHLGEISVAWELLKLGFELKRINENNVIALKP